MTDRKSKLAQLSWTLSRFLFHTTDSRRYALSAFVFTRLLALIYLMVFLSIAGNALNWIGSHGELPVEQILKESEKVLSAGAILKYPTLFWYSPSDIAIQTLPLLAAGLSLLLLAGIQPAGILTALYICFLSYTSVSGGYLSSPGYHLLLEVGFLASFVSSFKNWMPLRRTPDPPIFIRLLLIWIFIRASLVAPAHLDALNLLYFVLLLSMSLFFFSDFFWAQRIQRDKEFILNLGGNKYRGFADAIYIPVGILVLGLSLLALYDHFFLISQRVVFIRILLSAFKPFGLANIY